MTIHKPPSRPLSPHLQIYRPMLTMTMSIMHRLTGIIMYFGMGLLVLWLVAAAMGEPCFSHVQGFFTSWFGLLVLFGLTWALVHHALGGIRHFIWDMGWGFKLPTVETLALLNLIGSIVITLVIWAIAYGVRA